MATTNKMTKVSAFTIALELVQNSAHPEKDAVVEKIAKEIENLGKKSGNGKPTKAQQANQALANEMLEWMEEGHPYSISDLSKNCPAVLGQTSQKIRPLLTPMIKAGIVERTEEKGKPMFTKVAVED